jgi:hypothetical protein
MEEAVVAAQNDIPDGGGNPDSRSVTVKISSKCTSKLAPVPDAAVQRRMLHADHAH